nr:MAG TPA: hypothetical protein [Caudoviricetes sp.]
MREIIADSRMMHIGKNGEGDALRVTFPVVGEWEALYGAGGVWTLNVQRHGDALAYAAQDFKIEDGAALWVVTDADAAVVGEGRCELTYKIGDTAAKSRTYAFRVDRSLTGGGDVPDPVKGWQEALEKRVDGKLDRPDGGSAGDVLTKTEAGEEWKTMQSDWKEFDSSKPGYIKNKPFYTGLENQTYDKVVDMSASKYVDVGVSDFTLYEGTKYTVTWDGKKYESTCESDYGILHIGNFALYDIAPFSKTDTGEPFCVIYDGNTNQIIGEKSGASHHIVMLYGIPTVHMLSPAYIGVQSKSNYMSDDSGRVQYLATPDGNYELVVPEIPNIKNALNGLSEKRIATFEMTAEQLDAVSSNEYTEIKTNANIAVSGYNPNNLQSYYVDLLVGGKRYKVLPIDDDSSTANFVFETEQFGLPVRTYCIRIENRSYKQKIIRLDQNALNEKKFIFKQQAVADAGKVLTVGDDGKVVPGNISLPPPTPPYTLPTASPTVLGGVKPIAKTDAMTQGVGVDDAGALWTAAGSGGTDISLGLTSAQVGQIIKVKAVDDNGKPTQWEALNRDWEVKATYALKDMTFPAVISIPPESDSMLFISGTDITINAETKVKITLKAASQENGYSGKWEFSQNMYKHGWGCGMFMELNLLDKATKKFWMQRAGWAPYMHYFTATTDIPLGETDRNFYYINVDNADNINPETTTNVILYTRDAL